MNVDQIRRDLESLPNVQDVTVWRDPEQFVDETGEHLVGGDVSSIAVEIIPCDSTDCLIDTMKEHELVIKHASCGAEGLRVKLQEEGRVHS